MQPLVSSFVSRPLARFVSSVVSVPHVAIVGSGPAGFYTAQQLLKGHSKVLVDVYEKLPVPFGLVRYGVAPDHPEVKNVINTFTQTAQNDRCHFMGNVSVGHDVSLSELQHAYTAVVLDLQGVLSARSFVGWYNGLPAHKDLQPDLDTDTAVILGQGNVAIDVARILLTPVDDLRTTDITDYALEALSRSQVRRVYIVGRRGPIQAAFTVAEVRELMKLPKCKPVLNRADFAAFEKHTDEIPRGRKRVMELMMRTALSTAVDPVQVKKRSEANKEWHLVFLRRPSKFIAAKNSSRVASIQFAVNRLEGELGESQTAVSTGVSEMLSCGLVFRSIGYKSCPLDFETPFDAKAAVVPNDNGRVVGHPGLYCSGWVKRGPIGVLATTMNDAFDTGKVIVEDLKSEYHLPGHVPTGRETILDKLKQKGIHPVTFSEWQKIDSVERSRGESCGKPREKIVNVDEMLHVAHS